MKKHPYAIFAIILVIILIAEFLIPVFYNMLTFLEPAGSFTQSLAYAAMLFMQVLMLLLVMDKALLAIFFGIFAIKQIERSDEALSGERLAYAGIAIGVIYVLFAVYMVFFAAPQVSPHM